MNIRKLYVIIAIPFLLQGCIVSKKKYDAVVLKNTSLNSKLKKSESENKGLKSDLNTNIADFEQIKSELHLSNAVMSDDMSDLLIKVTQLTDDNTNLQAEVDKTLNLYKSQRKNSLSTEDQLKNLETSNAKLKKDTASIKYALKLSNERFTKLESEFEAQKNKYYTLSAQKTSSDQELLVQKKKMASFEQELVRNKEKIEVISKSLIGLRKEMLSAKTSNKTIDPNKNKYIDKMAKELGHY